MKKLLLVLVSLSLLFVLSGCFDKILKENQNDFYYDSKGNMVEIVSPEDQCVLYKVLGANTSYYKLGLYTANYTALKAGFYSPEEADSVINSIEAEVNSPSATVGSVISILLAAVANIKKVGAPEIVIITAGLEEYAGNTIGLDDCTRYKLNMHISKQKVLISAFKN